MDITLLQTKDGISKLYKTINSICSKKKIEKSNFPMLCSYVSEKYDSMYYEKDKFYLKSHCDGIPSSKYSFFNLIQYMSMNIENTRHKILYISPSLLQAQYASLMDDTESRLKILAGLYIYWQLILPNGKVRYSESNVSLITWFVENCITYEKGLDGLCLSLWSSIYDGGDKKHEGICILTCNSIVKKALSLSTNLIPGTMKFLKSLYKNVCVKYINDIIRLLESLYRIEKNQDLLKIMFSMIIEYISNKYSDNQVLKSIREENESIVTMINDRMISYRRSLTVDLLRHFKHDLCVPIEKYITGEDRTISNLTYMVLNSGISDGIINSIVYELYRYNEIRLLNIKTLITSPNLSNSGASSFLCSYLIMDPEYGEFIRKLSANFNETFKKRFYNNTFEALDFIAKSVIGNGESLEIAYANLSRDDEV